MQVIVIQLKPSRLLLGVLGCVSIMSCIILAQLPILPAIKWLLIITVMVRTVYLVLRDVLLYLPQSWKSLEVSSIGQLKLTNRQGQQFTPELARSSFVHSFMIILNIKKSFLSIGLPTVLLITNKENAESLRRLRIWLRWW
jgi:hypothetical protein